jgi:hypothetical protein
MAVMLLLLCGCGSEQVVYSDVNTATNSFGELIDNAPVIVIAKTGEKSKVGPPGIRRRPNYTGGPPVQRYRVALDVRKVLRGEVQSNTRIYVSGYESENVVLVGPPQGIFGSVGDLGVYFLRRSGAEYRTMVDVYRYWIELDPRVNLDIADGAEIPESIWRLLVQPYTAGLRNGSTIDFGYITRATGYRLGRARDIRLLIELARDSRNPDLQIEACLELNETHRGCGGEACLSKLLTDGSPVVDDQKRIRLREELKKVPQSNKLVHDALLNGSQEAIARWAYSHDRTEIGRFLALLTEHPDKGIRSLAQALLKKPEYRNAMSRRR